MPFVDLMVELREVGYVLRVRLQDVRRLQPLDAVLVDVWYLVLEEERVDALVLVVRPDGYQQETECIHLFGLECLQQMIPSEGQQLATAFAVSL